MAGNDDSAALVEQVKQAIEAETPLNIIGGGTKSELGNRVAENSTVLSTRGHEGIITYEPTELVVSVRAGTPLASLTNALDEAGQMLPFEPQALPSSTIGGVIACGLSGPRRPFNGAARDYVLGTRVINGQAQDLSFGGEVMKNVAGYDVSRVQVGAWGTLGVLLDISMKVLPKPETEITIVQRASGLPGDWLHEWAGAQRWLLTATAADEVFRVVDAAGGHATRYSFSESDEPAFQPLHAGMQRLQGRVRDSFDPLRIFNRGRFHPELDVLPKLVAAGA